MWRTREVVDKDEYRRSLEVLRRLRHGDSLYKAARAEHIAPDTVRRYIGAALVREPGGRYRAMPRDRLVRQMWFLTVNGKQLVEPSNSREATKLAEYWNAVYHYVTTGDAKPLWRFHGQKLRTADKTQLPFLTSLEDIYQLARAGELSFEDLYALTA
jgi:hypothetical protein